jgi:alkaline phosphatase
VKNIRPFIVSLFLLALLSACGPEPTPPIVPTIVVESPTPIQSIYESVPTMVVETPTTTNVITASAGVTAAFTPVPEVGPVHGIILFIGDGMGAVHRQAAQWLAWGTEGSLAMDSLPVYGMAETSAADSEITDSAAAATALASGIKTNYEYVGVDTDGRPVETILEQAQAQGWTVGLVTTVQLAHATPAAFAAHVDDRNEMLEIAAQMMALEINVLLGGGEDDFLPTSTEGCFPSKGQRLDGFNLVLEAQDEGYLLVCTAEQLLAVDTTETTHLMGFFGDEEMSQPYSPSLAEMTRVAIEILSQDPDGFFLMVEAGQIDWESHANNAYESMVLTVGLDAAVTVAQVYALSEPNTLIIVTADHETGGMSLNLDGSGSYKVDGPFSMPDGTQFWVDWTSSGHTRADVPVNAMGPYSELLWGEYPNTWIYTVMYRAMMGE